MKKLILIISVACLAIINYGQASRIVDLDRQSTYSDSLVVIVDGSAFSGSDARKMTLTVLSPKINDAANTVTTANLDLDAIKLRYADAGGDKTTALRYILRSQDYTIFTAGATFDPTADIIIYYDNSIGSMRRLTGDNILKTLDISDFQSQINATNFDEDYILVYDYSSSTTEKIELYNLFNQYSQDLINGISTYGHIYIKELDGIVTGIIRVDGNTGGGFLTFTWTNLLPPISSCYFENTLGSTNSIKMDSDGTLSGDFDETSDANRHIGFSYVTNVF